MSFSLIHTRTHTHTHLGTRQRALVQAETVMLVLVCPSATPAKDHCCLLCWQPAGPFCAAGNNHLCWEKGDEDTVTIGRAVSKIRAGIWAYSHRIVQVLFFFMLKVDGRQLKKSTNLYSSEDNEVISRLIHATFSSVWYTQCWPWNNPHGVTNDITFFGRDATTAPTFRSLSTVNVAPGRGTELTVWS